MNFRIARKRKKLVAASLAAGTLYTAGKLLRHARKYDFYDRTVLITGGSRGLGLVLARTLLDRGARPVLLARDEEELRKAEAGLTGGTFGRVLSVQCDLKDRDQIEKSVRKILEERGRIDVLINNAGIIQVGPCEEMRLEEFEEAMDVHFWGPLHCMLAVIPQMLQQGEGRIVNIASIGGKVAVPHLTPYSASKFALVGLSDGLRAELAGRGISITTVSPGLMRTGSHVNARFKGRHRSEFTWFAIAAGAPLLSMSAQRAANKILDACSRGRPSLDLGIPARALILADAIMPSVTARTMALVNRLLPGPLGEDQDSRSGWESHSRWAPSFLTKLADRAIVPNNEVAGQEHLNAKGK